MRRIQDIIHAFRAGDRITDKEAVDLRDKCFVAAVALSDMGDLFYIARKEALSLNDRLSDLCFARNIGQ